jgi:hypothetical protein
MFIFVFISELDSFSSLYLTFNYFILSFEKQAGEYDHCYSLASIISSFVLRNC